MMSLFLWMNCCYSSCPFQWLHHWQRHLQTPRDFLSQSPISPLCPGAALIPISACLTLQLMTRHQQCDTDTPGVTSSSPYEVLIPTPLSAPMITGNIRTYYRERQQTWAYGWRSFRTSSTSSWTSSSRRAHQGWHSPFMMPSLSLHGWYGTLLPLVPPCQNRWNCATLSHLKVWTIYSPTHFPAFLWYTQQWSGCTNTPKSPLHQAGG